MQITGIVVLRADLVSVTTKIADRRDHVIYFMRVSVPAGKLTARIGLEAAPERIAAEERGKLVFANMPKTKRIAVLDRERHVLSAARPVDAEGNTPIATDQGNHQLFSACHPRHSLPS